MNDQHKKYLLYQIAENNDQTAFNELFKKYFNALVSFSSSILKDQFLAEEVVEDVFIKLWHNRRTLVAIKNFSHYIYTATKYSSINAIKNKSAIFIEDIEDVFTLTYRSPENALISNENIIEINNAINSLPPKCRLIFRLIKEEGLKYAEVAQLLQISVKTVESQMTIAMKRLSNLLKTMLPLQDDRLLQKKS